MVLSLCINVFYEFGTLRKIGAGNMDSHEDFDSFWRSAEALWIGGDIYHTGAQLVNMNPPFWTVLFAPFGLMEPLVAYWLFFLISLLIAVGYLVWTIDELGLHSGWYIIAGVLLIFSSPVLATLALGQIYPVLALGLVTAWVAARRDKPLISGGTLGLVVALKPSLAPVLLWPLVRRRWKASLAAVVSGVAAMLVGVIVVGPGATVEYLRILNQRNQASIIASWDNASIPGAAARLFTESEFAEPVATLPWMVFVAYAVGMGLIVFTALRIRQDSDDGLWVMVAASLLASPIAWHNYLVLLAPGVLLLLARGRILPAFVLVALQSIPAQWPLLWKEMDTALATLALTLYLYILVAHWLALLALENDAPRTMNLAISKTRQRGST